MKQKGNALFDGGHYIEALKCFLDVINLYSDGDEKLKIEYFIKYNELGILIL